MDRGIVDVGDDGVTPIADPSDDFRKIFHVLECNSNGVTPIYLFAFPPSSFRLTHIRVL